LLHKLRRTMLNYREGARVFAGSEIAGFVELYGTVDLAVPWRQPTAGWGSVDYSRPAWC